MQGTDLCREQTFAQNGVMQESAHVWNQVSRRGAMTMTGAYQMTTSWRLAKAGMTEDTVATSYE